MAAAVARLARSSIACPGLVGLFERSTAATRCCQNQAQRPHEIDVEPGSAEDCQANEIVNQPGHGQMGEAKTCRAPGSGAELEGWPRAKVREGTEEDCAVEFDELSFYRVRGFTRRI